MLRRTTRRMLGNAAAVVDRAVTRAAFARSAPARKTSPAETLNHEQRIQGLEVLASLYSPDHAASFFRGPRPIDPSQRRVRELGDGGAVIDVAWPSEYTPYVDELAERYDRPENRVAAARLFVHREPRPMAICVHGYLGGNYPVEERAFPVKWFRRIGLDVALFVLPFHGVRANPRRSAPPFPGADPRMTNEGFRQAMGDLADLIQWMRHRGHSDVGMLGMSLGGYTTALALTVIPELAFGIPMIPLASFADIARDQGRLGRNAAETAEQHAGLDRVHRIISPLHRDALVDRERILVIGAKADQITPVAHARKLSAHFGAPLETWHGGHLLQFGRGDGFRRVGRMLNDLGVISRV